MTDDKIMMEEALKEFENISNGNIVKGTVVNMTAEEVFVDIGYKSEGVIPLKEFQGIEQTPKVGDEIKVLVKRLDDPRGNVRVSYRDAISKAVWEEIIDAEKNNTPLEFKITGKNKGGYEAKYKGIVDCFMPRSQVAEREDVMGMTLKAVILEMNRKNKKVVISSRKLADEKKEQAFEDIFSDKNEGDLVRGKVSRLKDFGAFVDFGGVEGLLHVKDMSWGRINKVEDFIHVGDEIEALILSINKEKKKISLGLKQKTPEPWTIVPEKYNEGDVIDGVVKNLTDYGAFVEIIPGLEGLLHVSDISWKKVGKPSQVLKPGENVKVKILSINNEEKKISLGIRQLTSDPWEKLPQLYPVDTVVEGKVAKIIDSGIFVAFPNDIEGFVHISDLSWNTKIGHPSEIVQDGQEVKVKVLEIDPEKRRFKLGLKQLTPDPWQEVAKKFSENQVVHGKVNNLTKFGAFISLDDGIEGLLHVSDLSWTKKVDNPQDMLKKGDDIKVKILSIEPEKRRISLGLKQLEGDPWQDIYEKYPKNSIIEGKVVSIMKYGIFVEIADGVEGLVHVSDFSWTERVKDPSEKFKKGDVVKAKIINYDKDKRQIALGIKQLEEDPYEKYTQGTDVKVKINKVMNFGVGVELEPSVEGFIHVSELSEDRIEDVTSSFKEGDEIQARVIENKNRKIKLSVKAATYGQVADEFLMENAQSGGVSLGDKIKKAMKTKK